MGLTSSRSWLPLLSMLMPAMVACPECEPEVIGTIQPKIEIRDGFNAEITPCETEFIKNCVYNYGDVALEEETFYKVSLQNPAGVELNIRSITLAEGSDPAFKIVSVIPTTIAAAIGSDPGKADVVFSVTPTLASGIQATVLIDSDASNVTEPVPLQLTANGVDLGQADLVVEPGECNFGTVGVGVTGFCDLTLKNQGNRDLEISGVSFTQDTDLSVFGSSTVLAIPTFILPGTGTTVRLYARPQIAGDVTGGLEILSNDRTEPSVTVPLHVLGALAPTAIARLSRVNNTTVPAGAATPDVEVLDSVEFTGEDSVPADANGSIISYQWSIVSKPNESTVRLSSPNSVKTGLVFDSAGGIVNGVDVVGSYTLGLIVTDNQNLQSSQATVTINAQPPGGILVQMTWDESVNDIDLHMTRAGDAFCSDDSCYYANCKSDSFGGGVEWDGVAGRSSGDPSLDIDDLNGFGPENINVPDPGFTTYRVGVHFFSGNRATFVTVKIFIGGALRDEYTREMRTAKDFWEVANITYDPNTTTISEIGTYRSNDSCSGF